MNRKPLILALLTSLSLAAFAAEPDTEAVEFYNRGTGHYFIAASAAEAKMVDDGSAGPDWVRTGRSFQAWIDPVKAAPTAQPVCRFYSRGENSHFYTASASECEGLKAIEANDRARSAATGAPVTGWMYEGIGFYIEGPTPGGCAAGTTPLRRVYNKGFERGTGANHRFVDDSTLQDLMVDRSWNAEGVAFCAQSKSSGGNANLPPTTTGFSSLAAAWTGTAKWETGQGASRTERQASLALGISDTGAVTGSGEGCAFTGQVQSGDGFRSLFAGAMSASGCSNAAFNGSYSRFQLERFGNGTLAVRLKRGDNASEASIDAVLTTGATGGTPPVMGGAPGAIAGDWVGTVGWEAFRKQGGVETRLVTANRALTLSIATGGTVTGSGFGCAISGQLSAGSTAGLFTGQVSASGCTESVFNGAYAQVSAHREDAGLDVEFEKESESGGITTKAKVDGLLSSAGNAGAGTGTGNGTGTPATPPAISGSYQGPFTADIEVRDRSNGGDTTTTSASSSAVSFSVSAGGALSGSGFGCSFTGTLLVSNAALGLFAGTVSATGCANVLLNGSYAASAHREDGGAVQLEMERESEVSKIRTKVKIRGTASRTGA